jgi:hypothetical protein
MVCVLEVGVRRDSVRVVKKDRWNWNTYKGLRVGINVVSRAHRSRAYLLASGPDTFLAPVSTFVTIDLTWLTPDSKSDLELESAFSSLYKLLLT